MADDTRQNEAPSTEEKPELEVRRPRRPKPKHDFPKTQAGKMWEAFGNPDEPINTMPGGTFNSAGGKPPEVTWRDAFKFDAFTWKNATQLVHTSCVRDSTLVGIAAGGVVLGLGFVLRGLHSLPTLCAVAATSFSATSGGMYYLCDQRRQQEARGMALAVRGMQLLNEKRARERAEEEAAAKAAEEERLRKQKWYKFW